MSFINKVILITGASSGIGEAISLHFSKLSARLSLVDVDGENLKKITEKCEKISKAKVLVTVADLCIDELVKTVVEKTDKEYGRIDIVVNCAGIYKTSSILDDNLIEIFDNLMSSNLRSAVTLTTLVAPILIKTKGCIINISSAIPILGAVRSVAYSVAVGCLNHFTRGVALELATQGVRVNCILPGVSKTNILSNAGITRDDVDAFWNNPISPLKKNIRIEEVAELVAFLASDKSKSMTGCTYRIDAGLALVV